MRKFFWWIILLAIPQVVGAQNVQPAIIKFEADIATITVNAAEKGTADLTLSWHVINVTPDYLLRLDQRRLGGWANVLPEGEVLPAVGNFLLSLQHPLDFGPPTYRLILLDANGGVVDERLVIIPYETPTDAVPEITLFTTSTLTLVADTLADGTARANVSWEVTNRVPSSNLVFEQVLADGPVVPVELPRASLWVGSTGDGVVAPVLPPAGNLIVVRLKVQDVISGEVYDEATVEVAVSGTVIAAAPTQANTADDQPTPLPSATPRNCSISPVDVPITGAPGDGCDVFREAQSDAVIRVESFGMNTNQLTPGGEVTFNWEVTGAQFALLEVYDPRQLAQGGLPQPSDVSLDGLDPVGSTTITIPSSFIEGARFILWAANLSTDARSPSFLYDRLAYRVIDARAEGITTAAQITAFIALPTVVEPGTEVTLSWSVEGADAALIELYDRRTNTLAGVFDDLPTIGSAMIIIPAEFTQGARFELWAADRTADGDFIRLTQSELDVPAG